MNSQPASTIIDQIYSLLRPFYSRKTKTNLYAEIARRLSCIAGKNPPWTWRYIQGIQSGTVEASPRIIQAVRVLLDRFTGEKPSPLYSDYESIQIYAPTGAINPGAWVLVKSRSCANPSCTIHFVPRVPWQKYCPLHSRH